MTIGRRCSSGCATWPDDDQYEVCPICKEETRRFRDLTPLNHKDAKSRKLHAEFNDYYENEHVPALTDKERQEMDVSAP